MCRQEPRPRPRASRVSRIRASPPPPAQPTDDDMEFGPEMEYFAEPEETLGAHGIEPVE